MADRVENSSQLRATVRALLIVSLVSFTLGAFAPLITVTQFVFFTNEFSLLTAIAELFARNELFLAMLITLFCGIAPPVKIAGLWLAVSAGSSVRVNGILEHLGRWSMLEVFVVALMVVAIRLGALTSATVHWGAYALAGSAILSLAAAGLALPDRTARVVPRAWPVFASGLLLGGVAGLGIYHLLSRADLNELIAQLPFDRDASCIERVLVRVVISLDTAADRTEHAATLAGLDARDCPEDFRDALQAHTDAWETAVTGSHGGWIDATLALLHSWWPGDTNEATQPGDGGLPTDVRSTWQAMEEVAARHGVEVRRPDW